MESLTRVNLQTMSIILINTSANIINEIERINIYFNIFKFLHFLLSNSVLFLNYKTLNLLIYDFLYSF